MTDKDGISGSNGTTDVVSFADHPKTIGRLRSDRSGCARDLTAREMLVELLRDIDSGTIEAPDFAVICMARRVENNTAVLTSERVGGVQNPLEVYGLLWRCQMRLCDDTRA